MLPEERRKQLDGIVQKMTVNREPEANVQRVVADFKMKYGTKETSSTPLDGFMTVARNIKNDVVSNVQEGADTYTQAREGQKNPVLAGLGIARNVTGAIVAPITQTVGAAIGKVANPVIDAISNKVSDSTAVQEFAKLMDKHPDLGNAINDLTQTGLNFTMLEGGIKGGKKIPSVARDVADTVKTAMPDIKIPADKLAISATKQVTGFDSPTITRILKNPEAFTPEAMANVNRGKLADNVKGVLDTRIEQLSSTGKQYQPIREARTPVAINAMDITDLLQKKYGIGVSADGKLVTNADSVPLSAGDRGAIEGFLSQYGPSKVNNSNALLNARKALDELSRWDAAKTDVADKISQDIRRVYDGAGKEQIPTLARLDKQYSTEIDSLKKVRKEYLNSDGTLKDSALNRIANATGKGKDEILGRLEQLSPGITEQINYLKAVEDVQTVMNSHKVGNYAKGAGIGMLLTGGNPLGMLAGFLLSDPTTAMSILRKLGVAKEKIDLLMSETANPTTSKTEVPR
jgi:hypothetical protein